MHDDPTTADDVILLMEPLVLEVARRYPRRDGIERDDLMGEAWLALHDLAPRWLGRDEADRSTPIERWFRVRIRERLRKYVRDILFAFLAGVPVRLQRRAIRVHVATERLRKRGVLRPTYEHVAQEALLPLAAVIEVAAFPRVLVRQTAVEWCEDHAKGRTAGEPELVPAFGPQFGWSSDRPCRDVIGHPIRKGSTLCCMACHASGMDHHPALRRSPLSDPKPEPKAAPAPEAAKSTPQPATRRERRKKLFGPEIEAA